MMKNLVLASFMLSFALMAALVSNSIDQTVLAQDLSTLKDEASKFLSGNENSQSTNNNSASTTNSSASSSSGSSLTEKATGALGGLLN
jgi:hypothetical protein